MEFHPVLWMFDDQFSKIEYGYFNHGPIIETSEGSYTDREADVSNENVSWNHGLSEVVGSLLDQKFLISQLKEYNYSPYDCFKGTEEFEKGRFRIKNMGDKLPMTYSLLAEKQMRVKYILGLIMAIPFAPIMFIQGRRIRKTIPDLPEASEPSGSTNTSFPNTIRMITLGESTIAGVGVSTHEEGFSGTLARELSQRLGKEIRWEVVAKSGYTARMVRKKLVPAIPSNPPDLIVIGLGGNDSFERNTPGDGRKIAVNS